MQLPEDFRPFNFELTKSHLFQQKLMPALHDNDVTDAILVAVFLQTVIEVVYSFLLPTFN